MSRKLIVSDGRRERELLIVSKIVVGRDPTCDLSEADPLLSRRHAEFTIAGEEVMVRDLGSRNGIYLNGTRVAESPLASGDIVRIGRLSMQYIEDASPLVALPELVDDATGIVFPGSRPPAAAPSASMAQPRPGTAVQPPSSTPRPSVSIPRPSLSTPRPPVTTPRPLATPRPAPSRVAPAPPHDTDDEATSYASASGIRKSPASLTPPRPSAHVPRSLTPPPMSASKLQPPPPEDAIERTRVVAPPVFRTSVQPSPLPQTEVAEEATSYMTPRPRTSVQPPPTPPVDRTGFQPPPAPPVDHTSVQPPPAPPVGIQDEATSFMAPRPRTGVQPPPPIDRTVVPPPSPPGSTTGVQPPPMPPGNVTGVLPPPLPPLGQTVIVPPPSTPAPESARHADALAAAVRAIASFLESSPVSRPAADVLTALEADLAKGAPPADLVNALKLLVERLGAATSELI